MVSHKDIEDAKNRARELRLIEAQKKKKKEAPKGDEKEKVDG